MLKMQQDRLVFVGRKRKPGRRKPSGDRIVPTFDPKAVARMMPHRQEVPEPIRHDPKAESQLGRYELNGSITRWEYDAGRWYAGVVNRYRTVIGAPNASPASNAGKVVSVFGAAPLVIDPDEAERRTSAYNGAFEVLSNVGQRSAKAVARVAVYNERCPDGLWSLMRLGLLALAVHRGFVTEDKIVDLRRKLCTSGK